MKQEIKKCNYYFLNNKFQSSFQMNNKHLCYEQLAIIKRYHAVGTGRQSFVGQLQEVYPPPKYV